MPEPDSISVGAILDTWSNAPWTNGVKSVPVKIMLDLDGNEDQLLFVGMWVQPKVWVR